MAEPDQDICLFCHGNEQAVLSQIQQCCEWFALVNTVYPVQLPGQAQALVRRQTCHQRAGLGLGDVQLDLQCH